jgi:D-alanine-D-alanine ligase
MGSEKMKKNIAVVCGGYSGEKVVSMRSANMVMNNIDREKYSPYKVVVTEDSWYAEHEGAEIDIDRNDFTFVSQAGKIRFDGVFMIIHGTPGENGLMQGYFEMLDIPTTTGDTLNMALTFNKKMTTRMLGSMGFTVAKSVELKSRDAYSISKLIDTVGLPCFVKPNCGGSSIGTSRVDKQEELHVALHNAFQEDEQVIIEEFIQGTEVTCGVIVVKGQVTALPATEIVTQNSFFDFEAKYQGKSEEITPARIAQKTYLKLQSQAMDIYKKLNCRGMIRVDFIIRGEEIFVIEINTTPGFSEASIIPQQAAVYGLNKTELISAVIESCF